MIEIEKKFIIEEKKLKVLLKDAHFVRTLIITDEYFDDKSYSLTTHDWWLRCRDGEYELKVPVNIGYEDTVDRYRELMGNDIRNELKLEKDIPLQDACRKAGYVSFAKIVTTRKTYKLGEFTIAIDSMDYGYETGEIELMVENERNQGEATKKIMELTQKYDLSIQRFRGKVFEYLWRNNRLHYDALLSAGVVKM